MPDMRSKSSLMAAIWALVRRVSPRLFPAVEPMTATAFSLSTNTHRVYSAIEYAPMPSSPSH